MKFGTVKMALILGLFSVALPALAQDKEKPNEPVYGWLLMSDAERQTFKSKAHSLTTQAERQQYIEVHRNEMRARAEEQGVTLEQSCFKRSGSAGNKQGKNNRRNCPEFTDFDLDGDGSITSIEFDAGHQGMYRQHMNEGRKLRKLANAPGFSDIDTDGNGSMSREEFAAHQALRQDMKRPHSN